MTSFTRGPLPARVYWTRRLLVAVLALLLVVGIANLLTLGSDGSSGPDRAAQVAAEPTASASTPATGPTARVATPPSTAGPGKARSSRAPVLAEPEGTCVEEDIAVSPEAKKAVAGPHGEIRIALHLRTLDAEACTWRVAPETLTLKITSGDDDIWSSRQCPDAVPSLDVIVRRDTRSTVDVAWNGRRSNQGCGVRSDWALPGTYHVTAAALAGEPADEQFTLEAPSRPVITMAPSPTQEPRGKNGEKRGAASTGGAPEPTPTSG